MTSVELLTFSMAATPPAAGTDWFRIVEAKKGEATKVYIYDEIGFWGTTAKDFAAQLVDIDTDQIELHINSPGGSVFDGLAIMAALKDHKAKIVGKVDGMAASAASFILQACDERIITRNAQVMIHDAKAYAGGNAAQMRKAADLLDRVSDNIADIYAVRSGQGTVESWRAIMTAGDEWYSGNEAVEAGLADTVSDNPNEDEDAPEEAAKNSWTMTEVEAFLKTSPQKLAASAKHVTITNRVEEAPMGNSPTITPPAAPQPPAPVQQAAPVAPVAATPTFMVNGTEVTDFSAVQSHIAGLEAFRTETIESGRKDFVAQLVKDNKIMADKETLEATETFALSLSADQFKAWKASMGAAPANTLFQQHGATQGNKQAPINGGSKSETDKRIEVLKEIVQSHRDTGMPEAQLETKDSYKELQKLKSNQSSAS